MKGFFIHKLGKDDYSVPKAYSLIILSNFLLNVIEININFFLSKWFISLLPQNQLVYTRKLRMEMSLSTIADLVESAFHRGKKSLVVSLE